ncbi:hypothetical protein EJ04DRAFT_510341 [Polyplosphaeria fusca]|uniref:Uncharacterized protein n=1 Tax=Polyplosphaeria fusca TaxID=682080 RepID=A0A9P4R667_9PLEO|nr:hypothetical protein EJ04DRAFT_510341 [Polyplosphaeria fusca]
MVCALVLLVAFGIQEWRRDRAFKADQMAADANAEKGQGERRVVKREPPQIEMPAWRVWALAFCIAYHVIYWIVDNFF